MQKWSKKAKVAFESSNILGESPVWDPKKETLFWVDIEEQKIFEMKWPSKAVRSWQMPFKPGMIALENSNHIIIALKNKLARFNLENSEITWLLEIENELKGTRANDGKCDAKGRLWLGTMDTNCIENSGSLYQIDSGLAKKKKLTDLFISNGLAWSIDNKRMYFIDSATYKVDSYLFDLETGNIKFEKTVIGIPQNMGMPDGMTIDKEGMLWIAHWNGFAVHRWNPYNGTHLSTIKLPVPKVSSVVFGGKNLDQIFITTAKTGLTDKELLTYPLSGHIFTLKLPITGSPANSFICDPL